MFHVLYWHSFASIKRQQNNNKYSDNRNNERTHASCTNHLKTVFFSSFLHQVHTKCNDVFVLSENKIYSANTSQSFIMTSFFFSFYLSLAFFFLLSFHDIISTAHNFRSVEYTKAIILITDNFLKVICFRSFYSFACMLVCVCHKS